MPRFSLKRLLASMTAIAIGTAILAYLVHAAHDNSHTSLGAVVALWQAGGTAIGAGITAPFNRALSGAIIGFAIQAVLAAGIMLWMLSFHNHGLIS